MPYLSSYSRLFLLALIEMPEPLLNETQPVLSATMADEQAIRVIWHTMGEIGRLSQQALGQVGISVRLEAIRTEKHQTQYRPLESYQDLDMIVQHIRPWQQVLMFIWRTQIEASKPLPPSYRFTPSQQAAWE